MGALHVGLLCNEYPPASHGGIGTVTQTLGRALAARGHRVTVVGLYRGATTRTAEVDQGVRVVRLPASFAPGVNPLVNARRVARALRALDAEHPFDVLEGSELGLAFVPAGLRAARVVRLHGGHHFFSHALAAPRSRRRAWLERRSVRRADHLCAVSDFVAATTLPLLGLAGRPIEVLPNPVDTTHFRPHPDVREEPGLIAFVGTVCEKKGVRELFAALPAVVARAPHARLVVVGRDSRDPRTGASFAAEVHGTLPPDVAARVTFAGAVPHGALPALLAPAAACVFPSHAEAQGLACVEALAMGKAVVVSRTGPGPELVEHDRSGLLVDPFAPAAIADALAGLLADGALRRRLGAAARRRAETHFALDALVPRNEAFYRRCAAARRVA